MVLSPRALPYARGTLQTLFRNCREPFELFLITDSTDDKNSLLEAMSEIGSASPNAWYVADKPECDDLAASRFRDLNQLRTFRDGHPCWRKITDPLLFARESDELILLDPDLYFPFIDRTQQVSMVVRTSGDPGSLVPSVRQAIRELEGEVARVVVVVGGQPRAPSGARSDILRPVARRVGGAAAGGPGVVHRLAWGC